MSFNKFISPQTLVVPLGSLFSLYSINTNGLSPTTVTTEDISATPAAQGAKHGHGKPRHVDNICLYICL